MTRHKAANLPPVANLGSVDDDESRESVSPDPPWQTVTPTIVDAIERQVLKVAPDWSLSRAIAAMGAVWSDCGLTAGSANSRHASCALIVEDQQIIGIFTERDIVRLTAQSIDLTELTVADVMTSPVKTLQQSAFQDIFAVLFLFRRYRIRHLPIVDEQNQPVGIVTPNSIRRVLRPANLLKIRRVADVMTTNVIHAPPTASVIQLAQQMAEHRVSCIVIADVDCQMTATREVQSYMPVGIVTERDIVQFQALELNLERLTAQDVMSAPLFLLEPMDSLWTAHQQMQTRRVRRLVVSWNWGSGLGIVTQTSLLKVFDPIEMYSIIESMQQTLHQIGDSSISHPSPDRPIGELPSPQPADQVTELLLDVETRLLRLSDESGLTGQERQTLIQAALRSLQQVQAELGR